MELNTFFSLKFVCTFFAGGYTLFNQKPPAARGKLFFEKKCKFKLICYLTKDERTLIKSNVMFVVPQNTWVCRFDYQAQVFLCPNICNFHSIIVRHELTNTMMWLYYMMYRGVLKKWYWILALVLKSNTTFSIYHSRQNSWYLSGVEYWKSSIGF